MNEEQLQSLNEVLNYLIQDEEKHWIEEGKPKQHIYHDLITLQWYTKQRESGLISGFYDSDTASDTAPLVAGAQEGQN